MMRHFFTSIALMFFTLAAPAAIASPNGLKETLEFAILDRLPEGAVVELRDISVRGQWNGQPLTLRNDPMSTRRISATAEGDSNAMVTALIEVRVPALIITTHVNRGESVSAALEEQLVDIRYIRGNTPELLDLDDAVARRNLTPGRVLQAQDIDFPRVVERGAPVIVRVRRGAILVETRGIAANAARRGDTVRVRTTQNGRDHTLTAVAVGHNICEVP